MYIFESDIQFAKGTLSDFVNGQMHSPRTVAVQMSCDHRYLQQEMFKICFEYMKVLAHNYEQRYFDERNQWACQTAYEMLKATNLLPTRSERDVFDELKKEIVAQDLMGKNK